MVVTVGSEKRMFFRAIQSLERKGSDASHGVALSQDPAAQVFVPKELLLAGFSRAPPLEAGRAG